MLLDDEVRARKGRGRGGRHPGRRSWKAMERGEIFGDCFRVRSESAGERGGKVRYGFERGD